MPNVLKLASSRWGVAMGIFIIGSISQTLTSAFHTAFSPRLARNEPLIRELRERYEQGEITADVYEQAEALERSKISSLNRVSALLVRCSPVMTSCFRFLATPTPS